MTYRISGLKKTEALLFNHYQQNPNKKQQNNLIFQINTNLCRIEENLRIEKISYKSLSLQSQTAMFNVKGLISLYQNQSHRYCEIFKILNIEKLKLKNLYKKNLLLIFSPSIKLNHRLQLSNDFIKLYLSMASIDLPDNYFKVLGAILMNRILGKPVYSETKKELLSIEKQFYQGYKKAVKSIPLQLAKTDQAYDLPKIFSELNSMYFQDRLKAPYICWSRKINSRRLGSYDAVKNVIIVNKIFNHIDIPKFVVEAILFHEMLHIIHPWIQNNGRRIIHSKNFKRDEKKFQYNEEATMWLKEEFTSLLRKNKS